MELINAIKDTPLPIILVLAGVFLIVLAFVTRIGGIVEVQPNQKGPAIIIGLLLLVVGIVLNSTPPSIEGKTPNPSPEKSSTPSPIQVSPIEKPSPELTSILDSPTPTSSPTPTNTYKEKYAKGEYPMSECGKFSGFPVYPIFISGGSSSFERVTKEFCQDAIEIKGRIRVASFSDEKEADMFLEFIKEYFDRAWKGEAQ
jgi:hypothetical protein